MRAALEQKRVVKETILDMTAMTNAQLALP